MTLDVQAPYAVLADPRGREHIVNRSVSQLPPYTAQCGRPISRSSAYFTSSIRAPEAQVCDQCLHNIGWRGPAD